MGRQEISALVIGLLVSVSVVVLGGASDSGAPVEESAATAPEESGETQPLYELIRGVSNYGYEMGKPGSTNVVYWEHVFDDLDTEPTEYRALLDSLSPGVRASYEGVWMVRRDAFKREEERLAAEQDRDKAEYAVFIEARLRRLRGEVPASTGAQKQWKDTYRGLSSTPQSMIGGYAATDAALDDFIGRARPVPPEVSKAWKTVLRLKSEAWDVQTCVRYQRAQFVICEHELATGCQEQLERALSDCDACSTDAACGSR